MLKKGLYEQLVNKDIQTQIDQENGNTKVLIENIDEEEVSKVYSAYTTEIIEKSLNQLSKVSEKTELVNKIVGVLSEYISDTEVLSKEIVSSKDKSRMLTAVTSNDVGELFHDDLVRPETSISRSSLFTGAPNEPSLQTEFCKEIETSDRIDMLVSFIKWSGLVLILDSLKKFTEHGKKLRIITTSYMGATDAKAILELSKLPNTEIKISYDTKRTRLHAKTYVFYRNSGFTTAYVGSSNLSNAAMSSGLEWNMKITEKDLPDTFEKINATFTGYWNMSEFEVFKEEDYSRLQEALDREKYKDKSLNGEISELIYKFRIRPYSFQQEVLDQLEAERVLRNHNRNLVVAATGTGKTVISAFDYKRFVNNNPGKPNRLLFVAHREEILKQSIACFRAVLNDYNFGDLLVGNFKSPKDYGHLFISIASFNSKKLASITSPEYYDFIVVDESHHNAAPSYQTLLTYYKPQVLLGLTATPERMDGKSILKYFDGIAAEIRLPEAIDRKLIVPFQYFCITDTVNLNNLSWKNGGYLTSELEEVYVKDEKQALQRADAIIRALFKYVADIRDVKGLGFCVSIEHAKYMAQQFQNNNIPSEVLYGEVGEVTRNETAKRLEKGEIKFIFVVDLYNEGVDIPSVNTILFLRPTESLTVFLQQLGRGLRREDGKEFLTVLDFVGQANAHYNFEERFNALLERTHRDVRDEIKKGFAYLPKGCFIKMEKYAQQYILNNIEEAYKGDFKKRMIRKIQTFSEDYGVPLTLKNFIEYTHTDIRDVYQREITFYQLKARSGVIPSYSESLDKNGVMYKALQRIAWVDSRRWIDYLLDVLYKKELKMPKKDSAEYRMLQMLYITIWSPNSKEKGPGFSHMIDTICNNPNFYSELVELLEYRKSQIDFVDEIVDFGFDSPLDLHCTYTRDQIFVANDYMSPENIREGVKYLPEKNLDILLVTLNKADKDYSPTTLYKDYSINETDFHWQSQSTTSANSSTGQRYIHHVERNSKIALFVRNYKRRNNKSNTESEPYTFLGFANYVSHTGSKPMNIIWRLEKPIPGKYLIKTNKLLDD